MIIHCKDLVIDKVELMNPPTPHRDHVFWHGHGYLSETLAQFTLARTTDLTWEMTVKQ